MVLPSAKVTIAFLMSGRRPSRPRKRLVLPFNRKVLIADTLTSNSFSTASLISPLLAFSATRNVT